MPDLNTDSTTEETAEQPVVVAEDAEETATDDTSGSDQDTVGEEDEAGEDE
ncbi:MAG: hypothetical protein HQL80_05520 [Magnetococcales bacterium]|nr:hypothetical protein [Magnetococcales bacterium]MBF0583681.1 hypothetical protein [Magnetococcales bacterium]